jgi:transketolase
MTRLTKATKPTRQCFSERMVEYGAKDHSFVVFESDLGYSTFSYLFGEKYPARYFNLGIAEIGTMAAAAGMSTGGRTSIVSGYGVFLTMRAVEVVRSFICYPNLNVKILSSHGGLTAAIDGVTHQATEDIAFMSTLPNMKVFCPCDEHSTRAVFDVVMGTPGPVFTRLMRDTYCNVYDDQTTFRLGGSQVLREGRDITIVTYGDIVFQALGAAELLEKDGITAEVLDMYSIKPFDQEGLLQSLSKTGALLVAENHQARNGLGYELGVFCLKHQPVAFDHIGLEDRFGESGKYELVLDKYGLSAPRIAERAKTVCHKR